MLAHGEGLPANRRSNEYRVRAARSLEAAAFLFHGRHGEELDQPRVALCTVPYGQHQEAPAATDSAVPCGCSSYNIILRKPGNYK